MARSRKLLNFMHLLGLSEWAALEAAGNAMLNSSTEIAALDGKDDRLKLAYQRCHDHVLESVRQMASLLNVREVRAGGADINELYGHFCDSICNDFCAVSYDDLDFWSDEVSQGYLEKNKKLVERKIRVERIFVLPESAMKTETAKLVLQSHANVGIKVRIIELRKYAREFGNQDFGLFDDKVVSYFVNGDGRSMIVRYDPIKVGEYKKMFDAMRNLCLQNSRGGTEFSVADLEQAIRI
jgi:hypothetical protein